MSEEKIKISVCIATYNGEKYIREQLQSILQQLSANDEVIISDDHSTDGTLDVIRSLTDPRIRIFLNEARHGVVPNFENALRHASGDVIFLSDQDDIWAEHKVKVCLSALKDCDLVVHNLRLIDKNGKPTRGDFDYFKFRHSAPGFWRNLWRNAYMGSCMAFRRSVLEKSIPFPLHILWHDLWIGLVAAKYGKTKFIDEKLLQYRRHDENASSTSEKSKSSLLFRLYYRIAILGYFLYR